MSEQRHTAEPPGTGAADGRAKEGSHARAISELFEAHNRALVSFLVNRLGNEAEAKEVAQEAYVRLLQLDQPGAIGFLRAYLFRVATNLAVDRLRVRSRGERYDPVLDVEELTDSLGPEQQVTDSEALGIVKQALRELPPRYRQILLLDRMGDKTASEIGKELGVSDRQIRTYLRRTVVYCRLRLDGVSPENAMERILTL